MDERAIIDALRNLEVPDEAAARARARRVVGAAPLAGRRTRRRRLGAALLVALIAAAASTAATASGPDALARWVRQELGIKHSKSAPAASVLSALPSGGRLLVSSDGNAWIVGEGPPRRVPNTSGEVGWSAFGHYLVQARGTQLQALDLHGRVLWSEHYGATVSHPVWSPDGNRIAFTVASRLWVTAADGTAPRPLPVTSSSLAPSWRPGPGHVLATATGGERVTLIDTDNQSLLSRIVTGSHPVALSWSADGTRLLVAAQHSARIYDRNARLIRVWRAPAGSQVTGAQMSPDGTQFAALLSTAPRESQAILVPTLTTLASRVLLSAGALGDLFFSPDGQWILVGWHELGSWLFFATTPRDARVIQRTDVARQLGNGEPVVNGWCCET
jgi:dipeptidyl aminopeptidase/acylaminoacyl peptidase